MSESTDELQGLLSNEIRKRWVLRGDADADRFAEVLLPVVTAYAEQQARECAAEELAVLASRLVCHDVEDMVVYEEIRDLRDALLAKQESP